MKRIAWIGLGALASVAMAHAGAADGKALFASKCLTCHGPNGEGKPAIAKMLNATMRPLGSKEVQARSDAEIKATIGKGQGKMKPVAGLSASDTDDVVGFVRTLKP